MWTTFFIDIFIKFSGLSISFINSLVVFGGYCSWVYIANRCNSVLANNHTSKKILINMLSNHLSCISSQNIVQFSHLGNAGCKSIQLSSNLFKRWIEIFWFSSSLRWVTCNKVRAFPVTSCLICVVDTCGVNEDEDMDLIDSQPHAAATAASSSSASSSS